MALQLKKRDDEIVSPLRNHVYTETRYEKMWLVGERRHMDKNYFVETIHLEYNFYV